MERRPGVASSRRLRVRTSPSSGRSLATLRKARALRPGDTIGIAAPASPIEEDVLEAGEQLIRALGFEPARGEGVTARYGYLAGDDARRAAELMALATDPDIHGILCARGGYGCHRMVSKLDDRVIRKAAKPLVGYSDITTLLLWQRQRAGLIGVHGPMLERGESTPAEAHRELARVLRACRDRPSVVAKRAAQRPQIAHSDTYDTASGADGACAAIGRDPENTKIS